MKTALTSFMLIILFTTFSKVSFDIPAFSNLFKFDRIIVIWGSGILAALNRGRTLIKSSPFIGYYK
jgi:hypothetical protein